ncbi:MAG: hypothetical protein ACR2QC_04225 [Gammaproteobacteria bacterium]
MTEVDKRSDVNNDVLFWRKEMELADQRERNWRDTRAKEALKLYRDERPEEQSSVKKRRRFNIFWANVEVLKPAVMGRAPLPDVRRRYTQEDNKLADDASQTLERALSFSVDDPATHWIDNVEEARDDMLIVGRGVVRERYETEITKRRPDVVDVPGRDEFTGEEIIVRQDFMLDGQPVEPEFEGDEPFVEEKTFEAVNTEYVYWEDYREGASRAWPPPWIAYRHKMSRATLVEEFGEIGNEVNLTATVDGTTRKVPKDSFKRAIVWEIWDKDTLDPKTRFWMAEGFDKPLLKEEDPLDLEGFYPQPPPVYAVKTTDSRVPIPEVGQYVDQVNELNNVTTRIYRLIDVLKARGLYDSAISQVPDLQHMEDGEFAAVEHAKGLQDKGGLDNSIWMWPIDKIVVVIRELMNHRAELKQEIFEITGISDIIRGSTKASETFGAQRLKAQFGSLRIQPRQDSMQRFVRNSLRIKAEIMADQFDRSTFERMTGREVSEEVMALFREDRIRAFNIDIETDSTVAPDAEAEKAQTVEFVGAITQFVQAAAQIVPAIPQAGPLMLELLKFGAKPFKIGRSLEDEIDRAADQVRQLVEQPPQQNPNAEMEERQMSLEERKLAVQAATEEAKLQQQTDQQRSDNLIKLRQQQIDATRQ